MLTPLLCGRSPSVCVRCRAGYFRPVPTQPRVDQKDVALPNHVPSSCAHSPPFAFGAAPGLRPVPPQPRVEQKYVALPDHVRVPVSQRDVEPVARLLQLLHGEDVPGLPPGDLVVDRPTVVPDVVRMLVPARHVRRRTAVASEEQPIRICDAPLAHGALALLQVQARGARRPSGDARVVSAAVGEESYARHVVLHTTSAHALVSVLHRNLLSQWPFRRHCPFDSGFRPVSPLP